VQTDLHLELDRRHRGHARKWRWNEDDLYWLPGWDRRAPIEETQRALDDLVAAGKVRFVGFSDVPAWVAAQAQTSLLERTSEGELLPMAEALGMGVLPWSPLRGGQLSAARGHLRAHRHPDGRAAAGQPGLAGDQPRARAARRSRRRVDAVARLSPPPSPPGSGQ